MKMIKPLFIVASLFLSQASLANDNSEGEKLFKTYCTACHGNTGGMDMSKRLAPPTAAVRMHYIDTYPDQASFVKAVSDWVEKQDESKSLMRGAINKFKIMPPIVVSKDDANKIAAYIYSGNIESPKGFAKHVEEEHGAQGKHGGMGNQHQMGKGMGGMRGQGGMHKGMQGNHGGGKHMQHDMHKKGMGKHHSGGKGAGKMMHQLNLSPQQKQQMKPLMQEKWSRLKPLKQKIHQINKITTALDSTNANYKQQVFKLAEEKSKVVYRLAIEKGEMQQKIEAVLTVEQRAKFKQLRESRKGKKHNH